MKNYLLMGLLLFVITSCDQKSEKNAELALLKRSISLTKDQETDVPLQSEISRPRMLIKTGNLSMQVADLNEARNSIGAIADHLNAYISEERLDNYTESINISLVIRVPSNQYDSLFNRVELVAEKIESKSVNVQDVTEEFIDTEARLKTKKELEVRYREILKQASTVNDILAVEGQLNSVRGEIESMEGRLKYLSSQVSFSTLNLNFYQTIGTDFGFVGKLGRGLKNGWVNLLSFLVGLANVWPFIFIVIGSVWFFIRWRRKKAMMAKN